MADRELFANAGFRIQVHADAQNCLWNHFTMNAAMEKEVLKHGSFGAAAISRQALAGIGNNMKEMIKVLQARVPPSMP